MTIAGQDERPTKKIYKYIFVFIASYISAMAVYWNLTGLFETNRTLTEAVDVLKAVSFFFVLRAGGEMAVHPDEVEKLTYHRGAKLIYNIANTTFAVSVLILVALVFKIFADAGVLGNPNDLPEWTQRNLGYAKSYLPILALVPFTVYSVINWSIGWHRLPDSALDQMTKKQVSYFYQRKAKAMRIFVYSNLSVGIALVLVLGLIFSKQFHSGFAEQNLFLSGAVAVALLASSINAKAVELYAKVHVL